MIKKIIIVTTILFSISIKAQEPNKYMGFVKIQDTLFIPYKIEFKENEGEISGFSLTDFGGEHETKSKIVGRYSHDKKEIEFKEVQLIYTKSPMAEYNFCNIHFEPSKFKIGSNKLSGNFKGRFNDGTECINGEIAMNSVEKITKRVNKFSKKVERSNRIEDSVKAKVQKIKLVDTLNLNVLKNKEITSVLSSSKSIKILIYDGGQIDNDIITVKLDGKIILPKYRITEKRKVLEILLTESKVRLKVISDSEGEIGTNTAMIEIFDGINTIKAMTNLKKTQSTEIDIIKIE